MWNNVSFKSCSDAFFQYKFCDDMFMIKCELYSPSFSGGKVSVHNPAQSLELGSLTCDGKLLVLEKTYPLSFLVSNGISQETISHFSIKFQNGETILSHPIGSTDFATDAARKLLEQMKVPSYANAADIANEIRDKTKVLQKETLPFLKDFEWHRVEDIKEVFSLSAIRHIVFNPSFLQSFEKSGFWFVGCKMEEDLFAVCIKSTPPLPNPMENALDCLRCFDANGEKYFVVGIGLFDDGQYFVRL